MSTQPLPAVQAPHVLDFISHSQNQTIRIGQRIGEHVQPGDIVFLSGELGTGKTQVVKGVVQGLGSTDLVTSPSFVLVNEYRAGPEHHYLSIYHIDLYRIEDPEELRTIGLEEIWYDRSGVVLVEWPERAMGRLPDEHLAIYLQHLDATKRILRFVPRGERYAALMDLFKHTAFG